MTVFKAKKLVGSFPFQGITKSLAWDQAPQWVKRPKTGWKQKTKKNGQAKQAKGWTGEGERAAEPGDIWCCPSMKADCGIMLDLIGQMSQCWQICDTVDSIRETQTQILSNQYKFLCETFCISHGSKKSKKYVVCCKKKKKLLKCWGCFILSCDKLQLHLQDDWVINQHSKGTAL